MIQILYGNENGEVNTDCQVSQLTEALKDPGGLIWVKLVGESHAKIEPILANTFGFHPLAIDDALHESHVPKVDDWQEYLYIVLRAINHTDQNMGELKIPELDIFLGPNYIVSYYTEPITAVEKVWDTCQRDWRWLKRGVDNLLYRIADELVSEAVIVVDQMQFDLDQIEGYIFAGAEPFTLERLFTLKRNILQLRRIVVPQRDVLNKLSRNEYPVINLADRIFFRDVYDHLLQLDDLLDNLLILVGSALDTYLSVINNRMNDVMKTLTVITALFMPLAFITGFFGMNFFQALEPPDTWTSGLTFTIVLASMVLIPMLMFWWMRRRSWI